MIVALCPKCGKKTEIFIEKFCLDCFRKELERKIKIPEIQTIYRCKYCGRYSFSKEYLFNTFIEAINHFVVHSKNLKIQDVEREAEVLDEGYINIKILKDKLLILKKKVEVREKPFTCKFCAMRNSGYKQAILQLRFDVTESLIEEIRDFVNRRNRTDFLSFISKIEKSKGGIDIYIGSKQVAYDILNMIANKFPIEYKVSKTLVGIKKGKKVYLDTIVIRRI